MKNRYRPAGRVASIQPSVIRSFFDRGAGCINLGMGEPDFYTPEVIRERAAQILKSDKIPYTLNQGLPELREKIASLYAGATADNVLVTAGSQEGIYAAVHAFVNPGDKVLLPDPGFVAYPTLVKMVGGMAETYDMPPPNFRLHARSLEAAWNGARMAVLNSPSNPTGQVLAPDELRQFGDLANNSDCLLVSDEIYREIYFDARPASLWDVTRDHIVVSGFSKTYSMTGWRLGWVIGPAEALRRVSLIHAYTVTCAPTLSQRAALAAFTPQGDEQKEDLRCRLQQRRDLMCALIGRRLRLPYTNPGGSFYVMLDISRFGKSIDIAEKLLSGGVITVPGSAFGRHSEGYLRLSFSGSEEDIESGIELIGRILGL
jgi:aspartate aminotransferase